MAGVVVVGSMWGDEGKEEICFKINTIRYFLWA